MIDSQSHSAGGPLTGVNMDAVHLDELPSYEASGEDPIAPLAQDPGNQEHNLSNQSTETPVIGGIASIGRISASEESISNIAPPTDAPPGYEETQQQSIQQDLDARFSRQAQ